MSPGGEMSFIHLLTIFILVAQSCTDQKMSAISAKCQGAPQTCAGFDSSQFVPRKDYDSLNSTLQSCRENQSNAQKIKQCLAEEIFDENEANIDSPSEWYERFTQKKQNSAFSPSTAAALFRLLVVRRENGHIRAIKTDQDKTWNQVPLTRLSDHEIDQTLEANPEEENPSNEATPSDDDTDRPVTTSNISPCEISFDSLAECFESDSFLDISEDQWVLYYYNRNIRQLTELKRAKNEPSNLYGLWLRQTLNYDGIILDSKNNHILAFIPEAEYFIGSQAITITGSDTNFLTPQDPNHSGGLLELTSQNNRLAVFKLPVKQYLPIHFKPGTKFTMQSHPIQRSR
jgi:hypothetical protein